MCINIPYCANSRAVRPKGFTLIELMVGVAISVVLLLALSQLFFLSRQTFTQISNASDVYASGFQAMDYLRTNIENAGAGLIVPVSSQPPLAVAAGTNAVMQGWAYLGYFYDNPHVFTTSTTFATNVINSCANLLLNTYPNSEYIALQSSTLCYIANTGFNKNALFTYGIDYNGTYATPCANDATHRCGGGNGTAIQARNDIYQKLSSHVVVTSNGAQGDQLSVTFAVRSGNSNITDCLGNPVASSSINPPTAVPILVNNNFQISSTNTLQCQTRTRNSAGTWGSMSTWTNIMSNVEYMRVMVGVNDNVEGFPKMVNRYVIPTSSPTPILDPNRIISVRLALVTRSTNNVLPTPTSTSLTLFTGPTLATTVVYNSAVDSLQRKLFTTTIYLKGFIPPYYPAHCVQATPGSGNYYIKIGGIPWTNSATTSDYCAGPQGSNCYYYSTYNVCETNRSIGEYTQQIRVNPH